jgi:3-hydroxyisobutyrate dehydrogenase-like beta-hydroxyacid dehydrogenase
LTSNAAGARYTATNQQTAPMSPNNNGSSTDDQPKPRVGCIGLGRLGWAIAANLIASGFTVAGYRRHAREEFATIGGTPADSPAALAAQSDVMISCLPDEKALDDVISGANGLLAAARPGQILIEVSTLPMSEKQRQCVRLAAAGVAMLDCPLSGNPDFARARQAVAFVSGEPDAIARARAVIRGFTDRAVELGPFGNGSWMKYLANMLVAVHCMAATEAFNAGARVGLTPEMIAEALNLGAAASQQLAVRAPVVSGARVGQQRGNIGATHSEFPTIDNFLRSIGAATPLFDTAKQFYEASAAAGFNGLDTSMIFTAILRANSTAHPDAPPVAPLTASPTPVSV